MQSINHRRYSPEFRCQPVIPLKKTIVFNVKTPLRSHKNFLDMAPFGLPASPAALTGRQVS
jgi:hypothetical protein